MIGRFLTWHNLERRALGLSGPDQGNAARLLTTLR